jgi:hypothetical protein
MGWRSRGGEGSAFVFRTASICETMGTPHLRPRTLWLEMWESTNPNRRFIARHHKHRLRSQVSRQGEHENSPGRGPHEHSGSPATGLRRWGENRSLFVGWKVKPWDLATHTKSPARPVGPGRIPTRRINPHEHGCPTACPERRRRVSLLRRGKAKAASVAL